MATPNHPDTRPDGDPGTETNRRPLNLAPNARVKAQTSRRRGTGAPSAGALPVSAQTLAVEDVAVARDTGLDTDGPGMPEPDEQTADDLRNASEPTMNFDPDAVAIIHTIDIDAGVTLQQTGKVAATEDMAGTLVTNRHNSPTSTHGTHGTHGTGGAASASGRLAATGNASDKRYEVRREIARGGMGAIMLARDHDLRRDVAMKVLLGATRGETANVKARGRIARFLEEAQITGQLEHPNIVPVHEIGADPTGRLYLTMKLVDGEALSEILTKLRNQRAGESPYKGFSRSRLLEVFSKVCDAVAYAHSRGVVHRDLKPANIMVGAFGEVMVMDWGIAKIVRGGGTDTSDASGRTASDIKRRLGPTRVRGVSGRRPASSTDTDTGPAVESARAEEGSVRTMDGAVIGTPAYMAPEQARGEIDQISERTDVYALGAIFYEILTYLPPYEGATMDILLRVQQGRSVVPPERRAPDRDVSPELSAICMKALSKIPRSRYANVSEMHDDISRWHDGLPISVYRDTTVGRATKWMKRHKLPTALIAATLVIAVTLIVSMSITLKAQHDQLATAEAAAQDKKDAITARQAARNMAEALARLDSIRLQVRSGIDLPGAAKQLAQLRIDQPGLYPAAFEQQRVLDAIGRSADATAVLEQLREDEAATSSFRAAAAIILGMRALEMTELAHPDSVDDLINALPSFARATQLANDGSPYHVAATALYAVAHAAQAPDRRAIQEATETAEAAVKSCPTMWEPWYALARARALPATPVRRTDGVGNINPASVIEACDRVLSVEPSSYAAWRLRARYTLDWRDITLLRQYEHSPASLLIEAHARRLDGDPAPTIPMVQELANASEKHEDTMTAGWTWLELAECAREAGKAGQALQAIDKAIQMLPEALAPRRVRARIYIDLFRAEPQRLQDALEDLNYVLGRDPKHLPALGLRGMTYTMLNELVAAEADFTAYLDTLETAAAHDARARIRLALGNDGGAFEDWARAVTLQPDRFLAWASYYRTLYSTCRFAEALQVFQGAWRCAPEGLRPKLESERQQILQYNQSYGVYYQDPQVRAARITDRYIRDLGMQTLRTEGFGVGLPRELAMTMIEFVRYAGNFGSNRGPNSTNGSWSSPQAPVPGESMVHRTDDGSENSAERRMGRFGASSDRGALAGPRAGAIGKGGAGGFGGAGRPSNNPGGEQADPNGVVAQPAAPDAHTDYADALRSRAEEDAKRLEELAREMDDRQQQWKDEVEQQFNQNMVNEKEANLGSLPLSGLKLLLGGTEGSADKAAEQIAQAEQMLNLPMSDFQQASDDLGRSGLMAIRAAGLLIRADGYVQAGDLVRAVEDFDAASRLRALSAQESFYVAATWMALANKVERPADAPTIETCVERTLGYLEAAVLKGLDVASLKQPLFQKLEALPRFKALSARNGR